MFDNAGRLCGQLAEMSDKYELLQQIGKGHSGKVWKARRKADGKLVVFTFTFTLTLLYLRYLSHSSHKLASHRQSSGSRYQIRKAVNATRQRTKYVILCWLYLIHPFLHSQRTEKTTGYYKTLPRLSERIKPNFSCIVTLWTRLKTFELHIRF